MEKKKLKTKRLVCSDNAFNKTRKKMFLIKNYNYVRQIKRKINRRQINKSVTFEVFISRLLELQF